MRWEYRRLTVQITDIPKPSFDEQLAAFGKEGWELTVAVQHEAHGYSHHVHLLFKRAIAS